MRKWVLAAVAALAVGQAEAATISYSSGPLALTEACKAYPNSGCEPGAAKSVVSPFDTADWSIIVSFDDVALVFIDGIAAIGPTAALASISGTGFPTLGKVSVINLQADIDAGFTPVSWAISLEYSTSNALWFYDARSDGKSILQVWMDTNDAPGRYLTFDNYNDPMVPVTNPVSPIPLPATAPLLGAALLGLIRWRRV